MKYKINPYNFTEIRDYVLLVNKPGKWVLLSKDAFDKFRSDDFENDDILVNMLRKGEFICDEDCKHKYDFPVKKYSFMCQGPSLHIIILTDLCNLNCIYCQASSLKDCKDAKNMNIEVAKKTVDFIFKTSSDHITIEFQGGEPLINYDVIEFIIEYAKNLNLEYKKDLRFALVTNFELMDEEKLDYLIANNVGLCTSLDGPKKLHDYQRKFSKSNYDTIVGWINKIKDFKDDSKIPKEFVLNALLTITKKSFNFYKEIVDEYVNLGFGVIHLRNLSKLGAAEDAWEEIGYSADEYLDYWKKSIEYIIELNKKGVLIKERFVMIILRKVLEQFESNYTELRSPCGACISQLAYDSKGDIYSCDEGRMINDDLFKIGTVEQEPKDVVASSSSMSIVMSSVNDLQQCDDCVYQPYCGLCPVCNYAEFGSLIVDVDKTMRCRVIKGQFKFIFEKILFDLKAKEVFESWLN